MPKCRCTEAMIILISEGIGCSVESTRTARLYLIQQRHTVLDMGLIVTADSFFLSWCAGFGWDRVYLLPSGWYSALFWI